MAINTTVLRYHVAFDGFLRQMDALPVCNPLYFC